MPRWRVHPQDMDRRLRLSLRRRLGDRSTIVFERSDSFIGSSRRRALMLALVHQESWRRPRGRRLPIQPMPRVLNPARRVLSLFGDPWGSGPMVGPALVGALAPMAWPVRPATAKMGAEHRY
jgi:hypothetical protein